MKPRISIIGAGASALVLANELNTQVFDVTVYDQQNRAGKKFLVAGYGGLNLTHSEAPEQFITRYTPYTFLQKAFSSFNNEAYIRWLQARGIDTFVGSSGRVFPKAGLPPAQVLKQLLNRAEQNGVHFRYGQKWIGIEPDGALLFESRGQQHKVVSHYVVFCLGGGSWPVTGSNSQWLELFKQKSIQVSAFQSSNCTMLIQWSEKVPKDVFGAAIKNAVITCGEKKVAGELVITARGIEGSGVYPFSPEIREQLRQHDRAEVRVDFKPTLSKEDLVNKLASHSGSRTQFLKRELRLSAAHIALLKAHLTKEEFTHNETLAQAIKSFPFIVSGMAPTEEAISTVGGIDLKEVDQNFELKKWPAHYAIGEMLDYDAPTGGYLLQSCFTMAAFLAQHLNQSCMKNTVNI